MKEVAPSQRKTLVLVHGQGEHCGRYLHFPYFLTTEKSSGVTDVCAFDLRGHGRSEGLRGHVERFDDYVDDLGEYLEFLRARLLEKHGAPTLKVRALTGIIVPVRFRSMSTERLSIDDHFLLQHDAIRGIQEARYVNARFQGPDVHLAGSRYR